MCDVLQKVELNECSYKVYCGCSGLGIIHICAKDDVNIDQLVLYVNELLLHLSLEEFLMGLWRGGESNYIV